MKKIITLLFFILAPGLVLAQTPSPAPGLFTGTAAGGVLTGSYPNPTFSSSAFGTSSTTAARGDLAAPKASPTFSGTVTMPDAATWVSGGIVAPGINGLTVKPSTTNGYALNFQGVGGASTDNIGVQWCGQQHGCVWNAGVDLDTGTNTEDFVIQAIGVGTALKFTIAGVPAFPLITAAAENNLMCVNTSGGVLSYASSVVGCVPSDIRLKNPLGEINRAGALSGIRTLRPAFWTWKNQSKWGSAQEVGFYAQDVCGLDPRLCGVTGSDMNYDKIGLAAYTVAALQEEADNQDSLQSKLDSFIAATTKTIHDMQSCKLAISGHCWWS